jgi:hypothetical protein
LVFFFFFFFAGSEVQLSNPRGYLLWAQSFIKLARTYYFPSQTNDAADTTDYFLCFEYAFAKFHQCIKASQKLLDLHVEAQRLSLGGVHREFISPQMQRNLLSDGQMHALVQLQADSWSGIGYGNLMMARTLKDAEKRRPQLIEAKKMFNKAESLSPSLNSTYNLACIGALLEDEYECKGSYFHSIQRPLHASRVLIKMFAKEWLMLALKDKSLPKPDYLSQDPDLTKFRGTPWFQQISEANRSRYESESKSSLAAGAKSVVNPGDMYLPFSVDVKPSAPVTGGSSPQGKPADLSRSEAIYQDAIDFDPDLNKLQASLLREGFSILTVKQMIIEVSKGKKTQQQDAEKIRVQKERLHERLKKYQLKEKSPIPAYVPTAHAPCAVAEYLMLHAGTGTASFTPLAISYLIPSSKVDMFDGKLLNGFVQIPIGWFVSIGSHTLGYQRSPLCLLPASQWRMHARFCA